MTQIAYFAAGCFWGVESHFRSITGVVDVTVGYMGGTTENPTYKDICKGDTNHAEVVMVKFDNDVIPYEALVQSFYECHDPTQINRQGVDVGTQYRSAIFYTDSHQKRAAQNVTEQMAPHFNQPIATEISPAIHFWRAEDYHQNYLAKKGGGCSV